MRLPFYKYQGTGNDFILIDDNVFPDSISNEVVRRLCDRHFGIGADGLIRLKRSSAYDFEMIYYNSDGNISSMCGNGSRCCMALAYRLGIAGKAARFLAADGVHEAKIISENPCIVGLKMSDVEGVKPGKDFVVVDTGSPHYVTFSRDPESLDVNAEGRKIRNRSEYAEKGINVNFAKTEGKTLFVRTYERGVECETLSCGTGVTATVIAAAASGLINNGAERAEVNTPGGQLTVRFKKDGKAFRDIWLEGPATFVFEGAIEI